MLRDRTSLDLTVLIVGLLLWPGLAIGQSSDELQGVERELQQGADKAEELNRKAQALNDEIAKLKSDLIAGAEAVQNAEQQVSEIEQDLADLETTERIKTNDLGLQREELGRVLISLERLFARPILAVFLTDRTPIDEARTGRLLALAGKALNDRARALSAELDELRDLRAQIATRRSAMTEAVESLSRENEKLTTLLKKKSDLQANTLQESEATRERMAKLSEQARNLKDLLERLEAARAKERDEPVKIDPNSTRTETASLPTSPESGTAEPMPATIRQFPENGTVLVRPVRGKIATAFGQSDEAFGQSTGLIFTARSAAEVVAPFDGQVVFEGPFRNYGQILIIEHSGGYHSVLAGLNRTEVTVGQWLQAGEPVGSMAEGSEGSRLYFELRHKGRPVDPAPRLVPQGQVSEQNN